VSASLTRVRFEHAVLFTGHMIDAPGRKTERFPERFEPAARLAISNTLQAILATGPHSESTVGLAGGASGGDILFHEVCEELGVPTRLHLALPAEQYIEASVAPAGGDWVERFHALIGRLPPSSIEVLDETVVLPAALTGSEELNIWQKTNLWMVEEAVTIAPRQTLLALWDGRAGDGPGGTEHMVMLAPRLGIEVAPIIRTQSLAANPEDHLR